MALCLRSLSSLSTRIASVKNNMKSVQHSTVKVHWNGVQLIKYWHDTASCLRISSCHQLDGTNGPGPFGFSRNRKVERAMFRMGSNACLQKTEP